MTATLTILAPGLSTLVVAAPRLRSRSLGVPVGGPADRFAHAIGNALVGNPPQTAALEISIVGPTVVANAPVACVVHGAPFAMRTKQHALHAGTTFTLEPGEELTIGGTPVGLRAYLCIQGGLTAPVLLDSASGLAPIQGGDRFACHAGRISARRVEIDPDHGSPFRILPGAQHDWFPSDVLTTHPYEVTPASNRMGLRLQGSPLPVPAREIVSEPVCPGTIQVTRDGQCVVLGVDGQTIGGYPKIAQVIAADLDRLAQLRPGARITFQPVSLAEAETLLQQHQTRLRQWLTRLRLFHSA